MPSVRYCVIKLGDLIEHTFQIWVTHRPQLGTRQFSIDPPILGIVSRVQHIRNLSVGLLSCFRVTHETLLCKMQIEGLSKSFLGTYTVRLVYLKLGWVRLDTVRFC